MNPPGAEQAARALHEATRRLIGAATAVLAELDVDLTGRALHAGDRERAASLAQIRSAVASMYTVAAHVLTMEHLWDERLLPESLGYRPVVVAQLPVGPTSRDAWRRAGECLAYGASYGAAAVSRLRRASPGPAVEAMDALLARSDEVAEALVGLEPYVSEGVPPHEWGLSAEGTSESTSARRIPRWSLTD